MAVQSIATKTWNVAVAGEIFADHVFSGFECWPGPGEEYFTDQYVRELGGGAAITASALGYLDRKVAIFAIAGEKDTWIRDRLGDFGVSLEALRASSCATAVSISISTRSDRSFLTWPGANQGLEDYLREPHTQTRLAQASHVHLAMPIRRSLAQEMFPRLRFAGCTISLDVGHHKQWLQDPENEDTCREVDFFFPNEVEGRIMCGLSEPGEMLKKLSAKGISGMVLKLGAAGAVAMENGEICRAPSPRIKVADTTGAGDAFDAGFIDAFLAGRPLKEQLRQGCLCGAASTRHAGALAGLARREELLQLDSEEER